MFERKSKEELLDEMRRWSQAVTPKLTDYRRGSVIRTIYEAVAGVGEGIYDRVYRAIKALIEKNLYSVLSFDKVQASASWGEVTFMREKPAEADIMIPEGTELVAEPNQYRPPLKFVTLEDVVLRKGYYEASADVVCTEAGEYTNIEDNKITVFVTRLMGIDSVTNRQAFTNARDEETPEEQKFRFQEFMKANSRGTLQAIEYGGKLAFLVDSKGVITERVIQSVATEDLVNELGIVRLYIWNGVGEASEALKQEVAKISRGYRLPNGDSVYGYKQAGTTVQVYSATMKYANIKLKLTVNDWASEEEAKVKETVEKEIATFFYRLRIGQPVIISELQALIKGVNGVYDIKLLVSVDNSPDFTDNNIIPEATTIIVNNGITYEI